LTQNWHSGFSFVSSHFRPRARLDLPHAFAESGAGAAYQAARHMLKKLPIPLMARRLRPHRHKTLAGVALVS
jgi:hypothetical protein